MPEFTFVQQICIWALPVLFAITFHEAAHALVAYKCGDTTAKMMGRLSLNPIKHIDPFGTLIMPVLIGVLTHFTFLFGYAKPVPISTSAFRHPRRDTILVALAGPFVNFLMAFLWALSYKLAIHLGPETSTFAVFLFFSSQAGILINLALAFLNLIPIPPLDGSRVVRSLLPIKAAIAYDKIEPYGFLILVILLAAGVINSVITPLIRISIISLHSLLQL